MAKKISANEFLESIFTEEDKKAITSCMQEYCKLREIDPFNNLLKYFIEKDGHINFPRDENLQEEFDKRFSIDESTSARDAFTKYYLALKDRILKEIKLLL